jgi:hypothetical protein
MSIIIEMRLTKKKNSNFAKKKRWKKNRNELENNEHFCKDKTFCQAERI